MLESLIAPGFFVPLFGIAEGIALTWQVSISLTLPLNRTDVDLANDSVLSQNINTVRIVDVQPRVYGRGREPEFESARTESWIRVEKVGRTDRCVTHDIAKRDVVLE